MLRLEREKVAWPEASSVCWPREVVPSSRVTVPVGGVVEELVVLAMKVIEEPVKTEESWR